MKQILLFILLIVGLGLQAQTTYTVINTNDSGLGSLRAAADSVVAGDTIRFSPSLIASGSDTIVLTTGEIAFGNRGVVIKGLYTTTDTIYISGNNSSRIFSFNGAGRIVLDSLVLVNGNGTGVIYPGNGGAVCSYNCTDTLFARNSIISGNTASADGGGISSSFMNNPSCVLITNSIISGNIALGKGGGISSSSILSTSFVYVLNSTISGNTASGNGGGIYSGSSSSFFCSSSVILSNSKISGNSASSGGAIYSRSYSLSTSSSSSVTVLNSSISGNSVNNYGGGILSHSYSSSVSVASSTISGNSASSFGGGIYSYSSFLSSIILSNSTISGNSSNYGGGVYSRSYSATSYLSSVSVANSTISGNSASSNGGGVYSYSQSSSEIICTSSIIADNGTNGDDIFNSDGITITSGGNNIFSDVPIGSVVSDSKNITATQLNLQALAFNGGTTQTMLPGMGSFSIDNGNPNDNSDAQNMPVVGVRDVGAAENCASYINDNILSCEPIMWIDGIVYDQSIAGPIYVLNNIHGCDSVVILDFTLIDVDTSIIRNHMTLTAQATNATYQWIDCSSGPMSGETNASFTATVNGAYQVEVTQNGCIDTSACFAITNVGIQEAELIGVSLYPNPTSDVLHIDKGSNQPLEIRITNSAGTMIFQSTSKKQITSIDMSKMATGIYVVTLKNELGIKVEKVVKR